MCQLHHHNDVKQLKKKDKIRINIVSKIISKYLPGHNGNKWEHALFSILINQGRQFNHLSQKSSVI